MMKFNYTVKGQGEEILLVHGWGGSIKSLEKLQNLLSTDFKVYNLELPGHGEEDLDFPYEMEDYASFVEGFIKCFELKNLTYIGHSFGGKTSLELLTSRKDSSIKKLILINSSGVKPKNSLKKRFWKVVSTITRPVAKLKIFKPLKNFVYRYIIRERDYLNAKGNLKESLKKVLNTHYNNKLNKIKIPTLLIWGEKDTYTPLYMSHFLNINIKKSTLRTYPGTHSLPIKNPEVFEKDIKRWIKDNTF